MKLTGCTIAARHQFAHARALAASFLRHHPDGDFVVLGLLAAEKTIARTDEAVRWIWLDEIGMPAGDAHRLPMLLTSGEMADHVKPWLLASVLGAGHSNAVYLEPDVRISSRLSTIEDALQAQPLVLTPAPTPDEIQTATHNPRFIALTKNAAPFLDWWAERLSASKFPAAERCPDFVPPDFPHRVLDDPACGVAYWNIARRRFEWTGDHYEIDGEPLRFFQFRGYDPRQPHLLTLEQGNEPRVLLSELPALAKFCDEYRNELIAAGFDPSLPARKVETHLLSTGLKLEGHVTQIYRDAFAKFERGEGTDPPSPFAAGGESAFIEWLNESLSTRGHSVTRYMLGVHAARPDLQTVFADPTEKDSSSFHDWFLHTGRHEEFSHPSLLPPAAESSGARVNVAGYFHAELGIGEAARALVDALEAGGTPHNTFSYDETINRQEHIFEEQRETRQKSDVNIVCVNADQTPAFAAKTGPEFFSGRYSIGVWFWEVEDFPAAYHGSFNYVDEIWVASDFVRGALLRVSPKPVFKFPLPITKPVVNRTMSRVDLGMSDGFVFLFSFDFLSVFDRKNPIAVLDAFRRAFHPGEGAALVIKTINGDKRTPNLEKLKLAAAKHADIRVIDGYFSAVDKNTMTALCDCYVSLHRSEGFGLTMAEAMSLGKPVIATAYSGNLEFMSAENSYLCDYQLRAIGPDCEPYPATSRWAEPDIEQAAKFMREIFDRPEAARARGVIAAREMETRHSAAHAGRVIADRLEFIRRRRASGASESPELYENRLAELEAAHRRLLNFLEQQRASAHIEQCAAECAAFQKMLDALRR
jgi:glycosyltransferase involved in cell wall biosynthesis